MLNIVQTEPFPVNCVSVRCIVGIPLRHTLQDHPYFIYLQPRFRNGAFWKDFRPLHSRHPCLHIKAADISSAGKSHQPHTFKPLTPP